jgi:hypothetical protein
MSVFRLSTELRHKIAAIIHSECPCGTIPPVHYTVADKVLSELADAVQLQDCVRFTKAVGGATSVQGVRIERLDEDGDTATTRALAAAQQDREDYKARLASLRATVVHLRGKVSDREQELYKARRLLGAIAGESEQELREQLDASSVALAAAREDARSAREENARLNAQLDRLLGAIGTARDVLEFAR